MKRIKLILTVTLISLLGTIQLKAQTAETAEKVKERLNLTEQQTEQFKAVKEKYKPELKAIRQNDGLSKEDKKKQLEEIKSRKNEELKSFLSADKYSKLEAIRRERKEGRGKLKKKE